MAPATMPVIGGASVPWAAILLARVGVCTLIAGAWLVRQQTQKIRVEK
jgi:hypothetical protein